MTTKERNKKTRVYIRPKDGEKDEEFKKRFADNVLDMIDEDRKARGLPPLPEE